MAGYDLRRLFLHDEEVVEAPQEVIPFDRFRVIVPPLERFVVPCHRNNVHRLELLLEDGEEAEPDGTERLLFTIRITTVQGHVPAFPQNAVNFSDYLAHRLVVFKFPRIELPDAGSCSQISDPKPSLRSCAVRIVPSSRTSKLRSDSFMIRRLPPRARLRL